LQFCQLGFHLLVCDLAEEGMGVMQSDCQIIVQTGIIPCCRLRQSHHLSQSVHRSWQDGIQRDADHSKQIGTYSQSLKHVFSVFFDGGPGFPLVKPAVSKPGDIHDQAGVFLHLILPEAFIYLLQQGFSLLQNGSRGCGIANGGYDTIEVLDAESENAVGQIAQHVVELAVDP